MASIWHALKDGGAQASGPRGRLISTIATHKTERQVPESRRELWRELRLARAVDLMYLDQGWVSGALRRSRLAQLSDVLVIISGGEGVEHLAQEYALQGKPVIPLDLDLGSSAGDGSGGAARLNGVMRAHPDRFIRAKDPTIVGALLARMATNRGSTLITEVVDAFEQLVQAITTSTAFCVRLLDTAAEGYSVVEKFFRSTIDPFIFSKGYELIELGRTPTSYAWMNEQIFAGLYDSSLVVVDLTALRQNCFLELGYALGLPRRIVLTAKNGTKLPFDTDKLECYFWDDSTPVSQQIEDLEKYWQRTITRPPLVKPRELL